MVVAGINEESDVQTKADVVSPVKTCPEGQSPETPVDVSEVDPELDPVPLT